MSGNRRLKGVALNTCTAGGSADKKARPPREVTSVRATRLFVQTPSVNCLVLHSWSQCHWRSRTKGSPGMAAHSRV